MKISIEVELSPEEIPHATELFSVLHKISSSIRPRNTKKLFMELLVQIEKRFSLFFSTLFFIFFLSLSCSSFLISLPLSLFSLFLPSSPSSPSPSSSPSLSPSLVFRCAIESLCYALFFVGLFLLFPFFEICSNHISSFTLILINILLLFFLAPLFYFSLKNLPSSLSIFFFLKKKFF